MADNFLLFDINQKDEISKNVLPFFNGNILPKAWSDEDPVYFSPESRVYAYINDQQSSAVIKAAIEGQWYLAFLPHPENKYLRRGFCLQNDIKKAIVEAEQAAPHHVDVLHCNSDIVLSSVIVGRSFNLNPNRQRTRWQERIAVMWSNIRHIKDLSPQKLTFTTANKHTFSTAALGVVVVEHAHGSMLSRNLLSDSYLNDGMCHAIVLAPRSVVEMLRFFVISFFRKEVKKLSFLALIKTKSIVINNSTAINYQIDGRKKTANELNISSQSRALSLLMPKQEQLFSSVANGKEQRKNNHLPAGEAIREMAMKPLPFIAHAATEEFKELYQLLRENAQASPAYLTLMVLSTLLASVGLYANSAPVIIGAMILAPLMAPIISLAMALTRQDLMLLKGSIKTLLTGLFLALGFAAFASAIMPMEVITPEIAVRLHPSMLDLAVAVISGIAGAYAHARVNAAKSMAGVAIAVALIPPLAITGIGLGWLNLNVAWGALLLFLTNLVGIVFSASLTFLALGFAPFTRAKKGLSIALLLVLLISIPLMLSFLRLSDEAQIVRQLKGEVINNVIIRNVQARAVKPLEISLQLLTPVPLTSVELDSIKAKLEIKLKRKIILEAHVIIRRE